MTQPMTRKAKLLYGFGDTSFSLTVTIMAAYFAIYLTDVVGISPAVAAVAIFIGRTTDYINDPIIGYITDRTRSRWGRRRPYLLFGALPFALMFIMMWIRPGFTSEVALAAYYALAYILFDISITFVAMPYFALTPELTSNYDERTDLTTYRMAFSILGSLIAFTVPLVIIGSFRPENANRVLLMAVVFGVASMIPLLTVFFSTKERKEYQDQPQPKFKDALKSALENRPFIFSTIIYLATWVSVDILQTSLLFFIKYIVQQESQSDYIMGAIFITAIFALPLWDWASRKWNKRVAYAIGIAFWAVVQILMITLGSTSTLTMIYGMCILAGIGVSAAHVLPWAMIPDAIEYDEWKTGARHEGMFYSLVTLAQKIASSLAIPGVLLILEWTGYVPNAATQPESALTGIRLAIGPIPAVLLVVGILFALLYPLNREKHAQMVKELEERRKQNLETLNG